MDDVQVPEQLQEHPFMRHLKRHSDFIRLLDRQISPKHSSQALAVDHHSQSLACPISFLASRGDGQVAVTFWPQISSLQASAAAELLSGLPPQHQASAAAELLSGLPPQHLECQLLAVGSSLAQLLISLGHHVFPSDQGLVDVSIEALDVPLQGLSGEEPQQQEGFMSVPVIGCNRTAAARSRFGEHSAAACINGPCQPFNSRRPTSPLSLQHALRANRPGSPEQRGLAQQLAARAAQGAGLPPKTSSSRPSSDLDRAIRPAGHTDFAPSADAVSSLLSSSRVGDNLKVPALPSPVHLNPRCSTLGILSGGSCASSAAFFGNSKWGFATPPNTPRCTTSDARRQSHHLSQAEQALLSGNCKSSCCDSQLQQQLQHSLSASSANAGVNKDDCDWVSLGQLCQHGTDRTALSALRLGDPIPFRASKLFKEGSLNWSAILGKAVPGAQRGDSAEDDECTSSTLSRMDVFIALDSPLHARLLHPDSPAPAAALEAEESADTMHNWLVSPLGSSPTFSLAVSTQTNDATMGSASSLSACSSAGDIDVGEENPLQLAPEALKCVQQWLLWDEHWQRKLAIGNTCGMDSRCSAQDRMATGCSTAKPRPSVTVPGAREAGRSLHQPLMADSETAAAGGMARHGATVLADGPAVGAAVGKFSKKAEEFWGSRGPTAEEVVAAPDGTSTDSKQVIAAAAQQTEQKETQSAWQHSDSVCMVDLSSTKASVAAVAAEAAVTAPKAAPISITEISILTEGSDSSGSITASSQPWSSRQQQQVQSCYKHMIEGSKFRDTQSISSFTSDRPYSREHLLLQPLHKAMISHSRKYDVSCSGSPRGLDDWEAVPDSCIGATFRDMCLTALRAEPSHSSQQQQHLSGSAAWSASRHTNLHLAVDSRPSSVLGPGSGSCASPLTSAIGQGPRLLPASAAAASRLPLPGHLTGPGSAVTEVTGTVKVPADKLWHVQPYVCWHTMGVDTVTGLQSWVSEEVARQQICRCLQCNRTIKQILQQVEENLMHPAIEAKLAHGLMQTAQRQEHQAQQKLQQLLEQLRKRRIAEETSRRQQALQEQLQDDLVIGTQGVRYQSLNDTEEISYLELQDIIGKDFAARFAGDAAALAALHVPRYWVLSDAASRELVQWVWEECLERKRRGSQLSGQQGEHERQQQLDNPQPEKFHDPLQGMLRMHHDMPRGLAGVVAAHARVAAEQMVHLFLTALAEQQQRDDARLQQAQQEVAEGGEMKLAQREYDFGVEWRCKQSTLRRKFEEYKEQQHSLVPVLQQQCLRHDLALYAAARGSTGSTLQEHQRGRLLAKHTRSIIDHHWKEHNEQHSRSTFLSRTRWWFEKVTGSRRFKQFLRQQKQDIEQQQRLQEKKEALNQQLKQPWMQLSSEQT